ncbi:class I SAM-dependent methyltransferase [Azospirillum brasilense]|uniref:class I SAM-dependent methyltransferase n=1 Tax=Azospirillum brasilense TaxID=192 RepID=UPI000E687EAA|nr:class I SAM-dependent methyltransferase [Azospirillum brasilense]NUB27135.1 methyltransferase domain-containing protein [Azospirillum brasilense]NUB31826.1 methyltransferase domain-containing protein [Azospirillum brasilense]RIW03307.1 methyltransferase domain-containing protein [Azospirillum brasilense]
MIHLICGPSCVGKSTFYESNSPRLLDDQGSKVPLVFPDEIGVRPLPPGDFAIHYNILRPVHAIDADGGHEVENTSWSYDIDEAWLRIRDLPGPKKATVLLASLHELNARAGVRTSIEPNLRSVVQAYPNSYWTGVYARFDLSHVYTSFIDELARQGIKVEFIHSRDGKFLDVPPAKMNEILHDHPSRYSRERIESIIISPIFEYQRIELPHGLATRGQDRSATAALTMPDDLSGHSVLDVGSAIGFFSFEAERRGAQRVVGLEPRQTRFQAAVILKEILGSSVEFRCQDILDYSPSEPFDRVLLLNVIHHLKEPIRVLRRCAELTRNALVIEFPQLDDPIFGGVFDGRGKDLNDLPLIGVSSAGVDQTFLFTASALMRILMDHEKLFQRWEIAESPMPHRKIMTFYK